MATTKLNVLISGAGIAGPCLAYWLTRTRLDVTVTIVERSTVPRVTGQAIDIRGPAIDIIKEMNLLDAVRSRHTTEQGTRFVDRSGKTFAQFDGGDTFTAEYEILRADLSQLLMDAIEGRNIQCIYGDYITSLDQSGTSVDVTFAGGSKKTYDMVVAADGSTSKTRSFILSEDILKDGYHFLGQYTAFFSIPSRPTDPKMWRWYNTLKGLGLFLRPHRNVSTVGAYLCITTPKRGKRDPIVEDALDKGTAETKRVLHEYFCDAGWETERILEGLDASEDFYMARGAQVKLPKWTNGRALVLGDAAFATLGVGTTLAIESAYVLAGELSKIQSGSDVPAALERYENVFRPFYAKMEDLPPGFPQIAFPQTSWGLWILGCVLWLVSKTKFYKLFQTGSKTEWNFPSYDWVGV